MYKLPIQLGNSCLCFIEQAVNSPLGSLAGHNGGIVASGLRIVYF